MNGYGIWSHKIQFNHVAGREELVGRYHDALTWFWESYGPSNDRALIRDIIKTNRGIKVFAPTWAWHVDSSDYQIYAQEPQISGFILSHNQDYVA
jgi:hypothetical protein